MSDGIAVASVSPELLRIARLERQTKFLWAALAASVFLGLVALDSEKQGLQRELEARSAVRAQSAAVIPPWRVQDGNVLFERSISVKGSVSVSDGAATLNGLGLTMGRDGSAKAWLSGDALTFTSATPHMKKIGDYDFPEASVALDAEGLEVYDADGILRAALGEVTLTNTKLGGEEKTAPSLLLFGKDGKLISRMPSPYWR